MASIMIVLEKSDTDITRTPVHEDIMTWKHVLHNWPFVRGSQQPWTAYETFHLKGLRGIVKGGMPPFIYQACSQLISETHLDSGIDPNNPIHQELSQLISGTH